MKFDFIRRTALILAVLFLSGCSLMTSGDTNELFKKDGKIVINPFLEIDEKAGELDFLEANDSLALSGGIIYASWTAGESSVFTASNGTETKLYGIEAYVLLSECKNEEEARSATEQWIGLEKASYNMGEEKRITCSDKEYFYYEITPLNDSPYIYGIAAFAHHNNCALSVELMFSKEPSKEKTDILKEFLSAFHYASD